MQHLQPPPTLWFSQNTLKSMHVLYQFLFYHNSAIILTDSRNDHGSFLLWHKLVEKVESFCWSNDSSQYV